MKTIYIVAAASLLLFSGCRNRYQGDVVKETYIHKYGVPVSASDWAKQGKEGQIVQLQKDGVTVTRSYVQGVLHGKTTWSFPNSETLAKSEVLDHGTLVSRCENYASGSPMHEERYASNGEITERLRWYEEGTPSAIEHYEEGLLLSGEYRDLLNTVEARVQEGEGERIIRNNEGELLMRDTFSGGEMVERTNFYSNGDPCTITPFVKGKVEGQRLTFFRGGLPKTVETWINDQQEGITLLYHNGEKVAEIPFVQGKKQGIELRFRGGSLLVEEVTWVNNIQHGPHKIYVDHETKTEWFHQGEIVSRPAFERLNPPHIER